MWRSKPTFLINLYKTLIRPIIEYVNFPFISASESNFNKLQKIENKIIRLCLPCSLYDSTEKIHKEAKLDLLKPRLLKLSTQYIENILNNKINIPILQLLLNQEQVVYENGNIVLHRKNRRTCLDDYCSQLSQINSFKI